MTLRIKLKWWNKFKTMNKIETMNFVRNEPISMFSVAKAMHINKRYASFCDFNKSKHWKNNAFFRSQNSSKRLCCNKMMAVKKERMMMVGCVQIFRFLFEIAPKAQILRKLNWITMQMWNLCQSLCRVRLSSCAFRVVTVTISADCHKDHHLMCKLIIAAEQCEKLNENAIIYSKTQRNGKPAPILHA